MATVFHSPPYATALGLGLASTTYFFWSNLGQAFTGIVPAIQDERNALAWADRVKLWAWFYKHASRHMAPAAAVGFLSHLVAAALQPSSSNLRSVFFFAAGVGISVVPFTLLALKPINDRLEQLASRSREKKDALTEAEESEAKTLIDSWRKRHRVRILLGAAAWVLSVEALLLSI